MLLIPVGCVIIFPIEILIYDLNSSPHCPCKANVAVAQQVAKANKSRFMQIHRCNLSELSFVRSDFLLCLISDRYMCVASLNSGDEFKCGKHRFCSARMWNFYLIRKIALPEFG